MYLEIFNNEVDELKTPLTDLYFCRNRLPCVGQPVLEVLTEVVHRNPSGSRQEQTVCVQSLQKNSHCIDMGG